MAVSIKSVLGTRSPLTNYLTRILPKLNPSLVSGIAEFARNPLRIPPKTADCSRPSVSDFCCTLTEGNTNEHLPRLLPHSAVTKTI